MEYANNKGCSFHSLPQSAALTAPSSEGAKRECALQVQHPLPFSDKSASKNAPHQSLPCVRGGGQNLRFCSEGLCGRYFFYCKTYAKSYYGNNPSVSFADSSLIRGSQEIVRSSGATPPQREPRDRTIFGCNPSSEGSKSVVSRLLFYAPCCLRPLPQSWRGSADPWGRRSGRAWAGSQRSPPWPSAAPHPG